MRTLRRLAPSAMKALADCDGIPDYDFRRSRWELPPGMIAWCDTHNLVGSQPIESWIAATVEEWNARPHMRKRLEWRTPEPHFQAGWPYRVENPKNHLAPVGAHPDVESEQAFIRRAQRHWDARYKSLRRQGFSLPLSKTQDAHFEWLVRYQVLGESQSSIHRRDRRDLATVREGLSRTARLLRLRLRSSHRGGRPRHS